MVCTMSNIRLSHEHEKKNIYLLCLSLIGSVRNPQSIFHSSLLYLIIGLSRDDELQSLEHHWGKLFLWPSKCLERISEGTYIFPQAFEKVQKIMLSFSAQRVQSFRVRSPYRKSLMSDMFQWGNTISSWQQINMFSCKRLVHIIKSVSFHVLAFVLLVNYVTWSLLCHSGRDILSKLWQCSPGSPMFYPF